MHRTQNIYVHIFAQRPIAHLTRHQQRGGHPRRERDVSLLATLAWSHLYNARSIYNIMPPYWQQARNKKNEWINLNDFSMSFLDLHSNIANLILSFNLFVWCWMFRRAYESKLMYSRRNTILEMSIVFSFTIEHIYFS